MFIAERIYTHADQEAFATLSGDYNPMHIDPILARREMLGAIVVHGVHALLNSMEAFVVHAEIDSPIEIQSLNVTFTNAIFLQEPTYLGIVNDDAATVQLNLSGPLDSQLMTIKMRFNRCDVLPDTDSLFENPICGQPQDLLFANLENYSGEFPLASDAEASRQRWPTLFSVLGSKSLVDILSLSRMVGMKCPGLQSIFSGIKLIANPEVSQIFRYHVMSVDERFSRVLIAAQGCKFQGEIDTFYRPLPQPQMTAEAARLLTKPAEFDGFTTWIMGGSRGIGEVAAKLIAAGGGLPVITYHRGESDAQQVVDQIQSSGGQCGMQSFDAKDPDPAYERLVSEHGLPNAVLYFASPKIFLQKTAQYNKDVLSEFVGCYVDGMNRLYRLLRDRNPKHPLVWFHPSSSAIEEPVKGLVEYSAAKAAAEILMEHIDRFDRFTSVLQVRLPRIATDQTTTLMPFPAEKAEDVLLPILRELYRLASVGVE